MALPTKDDIVKLDITVETFPICVVAKSTVTVLTLDYFLGGPFVCNPSAGGGGAPTAILKTIGTLSLAGIKTVGGMTLANMKSIGTQTQF